MSKLRKEAVVHINDFVKNFSSDELNLMMNMTGIRSGNNQYRNYHQTRVVNPTIESLIRRGIAGRTTVKNGSQEDFVYYLNGLGLAIIKIFRSSIRKRRISYYDIKEHLAFISEE